MLGVVDAALEPVDVAAGGEGAARRRSRSARGSARGRRARRRRRSARRSARGSSRSVESGPVAASGSRSRRRPRSTASRARAARWSARNLGLCGFDIRYLLGAVRAEPTLLLVAETRREKLATSSAASCPTAPGRLRLPRPLGRRPVRGQGELDPQAGRVALRAARRAGAARACGGDRGADRPHRLDRVPGDRDRGGGAARRAELHQAPTAPASTSACATTSRIRTSGSASTRSTPASTSRASATGRTAPTSAPSRPPSGCARRSTCSASCSSTAPARGRSPAGAPASPASTTTSSAARPPASATSTREEYRRNIDRDRRLPLRPLPRDRRRPGGQDGRGLRRRRTSSAPRSSATGSRRCGA